MIEKLLFFTTVLCITVCVCTSCVKKQYDMWGDVSGVVTDSVGMPFSGVMVTLSPGSKNALTGSDGYFEFLDLDAGQYTIQAVKSGYGSDRKFVHVVIGENTFITILLKPQP